MPVRFDVVSLFPDMFSVVRDLGVTARAHKQGLWSLGLWNPRDYTHDVHRTVDDRPYGGGPGMVMLAEPLELAVAAARDARVGAGAGAGREAASDDLAGVQGPGPQHAGQGHLRVILMSPAGRRYDQSMAEELAGSEGAIVICGRYEGIDQRFIDRNVTDEVSLGDFVMSGGEIGALAMIDSVVRLLPGALNAADSALQDSFASALTGLLDSPHYTRPELYRGSPVPDELLSGHHANIAVWRRRQSLALTWSRRPDLIDNARRSGLLSKADEAYLEQIQAAKRAVGDHRGD
ncbi:tRNA (guanosine(37)-N1)-methyltransferase TrmD [Parapusillimonas sp. SGNA-6]|nr:tRNA (guanosine(37)-N1)-methyltransferase TrmD [Parapusillimonas sp. SGNA-6]